MKKLALILLIIVFSSCEKDPCKDVTCLNGSVCDDGSCLCLEGYGGRDCGTEIAPRLIYISQIAAPRFPIKKADGKSWDSGAEALPDVYPIIIKNQTTEWTSKVHEIDADMYNLTAFTVNPMFEITDVKSTYEIELYDYDFNEEDEFMGKVQFVPYQEGKNFPMQFTIDDGGEVAITISVFYLW